MVFADNFERPREGTGRWKSGGLVKLKIGKIIDHILTVGIGENGKGGKIHGLRALRQAGRIEGANEDVAAVGFDDFFQFQRVFACRFL